MSEDTLEQTSPGPALAAAREAANLTVREVSDALNLSITVVEALESGNQERLPGPVFTKGYVRAYARYLDLDPEPLVADMDTSEQASEPTPSPQGRVGASIVLPPAAWVAGGVLLFLLLVWLLWPAGEDPDAVQAPMSEASGQASFSTPGDDSNAATGIGVSRRAGEVDVGTATVAVSAEIPPSASESSAVLGETPQNGLAASSGNEAAALDADPGDSLGSAGSEIYRPLTATGTQRLALDFVEDCWVEIKDAQGDTLFADLGRPGRSFKFRGEGPFHILLGYAPGALLSFNEEPVALSPHTRNNVASVVLGQ